MSDPEASSRVCDMLTINSVHSTSVCSADVAVASAHHAHTEHLIPSEISLDLCEVDRSRRIIVNLVDRKVRDVDDLSQV